MPWPPRAPGVAALVFVAVLLFFPYRHFTTDDAFIHYRFARNLAAGHGFSYNPGEPTYGDTAPLWVALVAIVGERLVEWELAAEHPAAAAGGATDAWRLASKLLDALSIVACILLFAALARRRIRAPRWGAAAVTGLFLLDPWFIKWGMAGMETPLAVALVLLALVLRDGRRNSGGLDPWTPCCIGIGYLVRPELGLLAVALVVDILWCERRRRRADLWLALLVPVAAVLPWLLHASATFGTPLPDTLAARRDVNYSFLYIATKLGKILLSTHAIPLVALTLGIARGDWRRRGQQFPLLAVVLVCAFYLGWRVSVGARYLLIVTPLVALVGYEALLAGLSRRPRLRAGAMAVAAVVLVAVQLGAVRFVTAWPEGLDGRLFEVARWLRAETPADAVVAAHEIGVIGHISGRRVLDLAALVSPDVVPVSRTGSVARSLGDRRPDYLVWNANESPDRWLLDDMSGRLEPLLVRKVHREGSSHLGGWQYYTVYRISR